MRSASEAGADGSTFASQQGRWSDPDQWAKDARSCRIACDRVGACDWREDVLLGSVAGTLLLGTVWAGRRRRRHR